MFNKRNVAIFIIASVLFMISFGFGYFIMDRSTINKANISQENNSLEDDIPNIQIVKEENRVSPNTFVEERIHYKKCGHLVSNIKLANDEIVNMTKEELNEYLYSNKSNLRLISFSNVKVVLWGERSYLCKDHYVIGEENGKIAIFKIDDNGNMVLDKVFVDYPINLLRDVDQERIKDGIVVDTEDELSDILEDYIS